MPHGTRWQAARVPQESRRCLHGAKGAARGGARLLHDPAGDQAEGQGGRRQETRKGPAAEHAHRGAAVRRPVHARPIAPSTPLFLPCSLPRAPARRRRRTIDASCFGPPDAPRRFVSIEHDDDGFVYFFGQLLICFSFVYRGVHQEAIFAEYVWPGEPGHAGIRTRDEDGISLVTKYTHTPRKLYEVLDLRKVLCCAPLVTPLPLREPRSNCRPYYVLNDDIYWIY